MTSPSPLLYDSYYHIYNRGVNGENIFIEERNFDRFLKLIEKYLIPVADLFAYCLLRNHFHLSLRIKSEDEIKEALTPMTGQVVSSPNKHQSNRSNPLKREAGQSRKCRHGATATPLGSHYVSDQFSNLFNAYAKTINKAYGRSGSLFQHPFGRVPITTDRQFWNVIAYIHQNPQKHGFAHSRMRDFRDWKYSSYGLILMEKPTLINRAEVLKWFGTRDDYFSLHNQWVTDSQARWFAGASDNFD